MDQFDFTVVQPCGVEILKVFASTQQLPNLEGESMGGGIKRLKLSVNGITGRLRSISVTQKEVERAEASCVVTTMIN